jgi:hypothetical protein
MTPFTDQEIIARVAGHATQAVGELSDFVQRAELAVALVIALRDALYNELTSGAAPGGREWEVRQLDALRDAAEHYRTEAERVAKG